MMFGDQHLARFGSMSGKQGAELAQQLAAPEEDQQPQVRPTNARGPVTPPFKSPVQV